MEHWFLIKIKIVVKVFLLLVCNILLLDTQQLWAQQRLPLGKITSPLLQEISGIAPSYNLKGDFWVHNDSGDAACIYLIDSSAVLKAVVELEGVMLIDAEDISSFQIDGVPYLLLADIGNNLRNRDTLSLYLFKEPTITSTDKKYRIAKNDIVEIRFKYVDKNRDAEAIFVDPINWDVYVISKRDFHSTLFKLSLSASKRDSVQCLSPIWEFPFTFVTAADFSNDSKYIVVKNLTNIYLWKRADNQSVLAALKGAYSSVPYHVEPQGEAVCFDLTGRFFYTISERPLGLDAYLYKYVY